MYNIFKIETEMLSIRKDDNQKENFAKLDVLFNLSKFDRSGSVNFMKSYHEYLSRFVYTFVSRLDEDEYNYLVSAVKENCYNAFNLDTLYNKLTLIKVAPSEIKNEKQHEHLWLENRGLVSGELLNDPSYVFYKVDLSGLSDIFKFGYDEVLLVVDIQLNRLAPISRALNFITLNFIQYHVKEITSGTYPKIADNFFDCFLEDKKC